MPTTEPPKKESAKLSNLAKPPVITPRPVTPPPPAPPGIRPPSASAAPAAPLPRRAGVFHGHARASSPPARRVRRAPPAPPPAAAPAPAPPAPAGSSASTAPARRSGRRPRLPGPRWLRFPRLLRCLGPPARMPPVAPGAGGPPAPATGGPRPGRTRPSRASDRDRGAGADAAVVKPTPKKDTVRIEVPRLPNARPPLRQPSDSSKRNR